MGKLTEEQWEIIIAKYKGGEIMASLAREFRCNPETIRKTLERRGVKTTKKAHVVLSEEQWQQIIAGYEMGKTPSALARDFGCSSEAIRKTLERRGIKTYKKPCKNLSKDQWAKIIERYQAGEISASLAREFGISGDAIDQMLDRRDIKKHGRSYVQRTYRGHTVNEHAFDELTSESAYWVGFLMADGAIVRGNGVNLELQARDIEHLHKFRSFLSSNNPIRYRKSRNTYSFCVYSTPLSKKLAEYGIVPRKTFIAKAPDFLIYNADFWRGVVDGDGHIKLTYQPSYFHTTHNSWTKPRWVARLELVGSETLMTQFAMYVQDKVPRFGGSVRPVKSVFRVDISANIAKEVIQSLYSNANTVLDRKAEVARQILSS